jgi:hypothetical protein
MTMDKDLSAGRRIAAKVTSWGGVTSGLGCDGDFAFKVSGHEIGRLHGEAAAHFSFSRPLWHQLRKAGRISTHPVFPEREGPAARRILSDEDVDDVIRLMRLNYDAILDRLDRKAVRAAMPEHA